MSVLICWEFATGLAILIPSANKKNIISSCISWLDFIIIASLNLFHEKVKDMWNNVMNWYWSKWPVTKYEVDTSSNKKLMIVCLCCHGNMVSLATSHAVDWYCPLRPVYQILSFQPTKQWGYALVVMTTGFPQQRVILLIGDCCKGPIYQIWGR